MIKYTILYKNGKTWNGKARYLEDVPVPNNAVLMMFRDVECYVCRPSCDGSWFDVLFVPELSKIKPPRKPNPKSKTKKQKALEDGYHRWVRDWHHRGSSDITMQAYKKWLYEQSQEKYLSEVAGALPEYKVALYTNTDKQDNGDWLPWSGGECPVPKGTMAHVKYRDGEEAICTVSLLDTDAGFKRIGEGGRVATNWYILPGFSFDEDIIAYKLYEEETSPNEPQKITFASGATISFEQPIETPVDIKINWEGVYKPWKESALSKFKIEAKKVADGEASYILLGRDYDYPIKTTYTFWLGALGEVADV